ncbi:MAG: hypothetical protein ACLTSG_02600 [Lachnospiraceae bacterium]
MKLRFAPVCTRRYERLEVDASELESFRLPEGAERNIYRLSVTGETDAPPDLAALRRRLEASASACACGTRPACAGTSGLARRRTACAGLSCAGCARNTTPRRTRRGREAVTRAVRWGLAALDGGEEAEEL